MKILYVADPVEHLKPAGDSTLVMLRESLRRKDAAYWCTPEELYLHSEKVGTFAAPCLECPVGEIPKLGERVSLLLSAFDVVMIRKDPPFDADFLKMCWMLGLAESKTYLMNSPSVLVRYHEKLLPFEAVAHGFLKEEDVIPTFVGDVPAAEAFLAAMGEKQVIDKPFFGFAGSNVNLNDRNAVRGRADLARQLMQPFLPEVSRGDRRVFFLDGKLLGHFVRLPKPGGFISNLAQGGSAAQSPLGAKEEQALLRLGKFLKHAGIHLAGADVIGDRISEVNITSPTGLASLLKLEGRDYSIDILNFAAAQAKNRGRH